VLIGDEHGVLVDLVLEALEVSLQLAAAGLPLLGLPPAHTKNNPKPQFHNIFSP
jgi:hypothetical protein